MRICGNQCRGFPDLTNLVLPANDQGIASSLLSDYSMEIYLNMKREVVFLGGSAVLYLVAENLSSFSDVS